MLQTVDFGSGVFCAVCIATLLLCVHSAINLFLGSRKVMHWRSVEGRLGYLSIFRVNVGRTSSLEPEIFQSWEPGAEVEYSYTYGNATFTAKTVSLADFPPKLWAVRYGDELNRLKDAYSNKQPVKVLLNPDSPHEAILLAPSVSGPIKRAMMGMLVSGPLLAIVSLQGYALTTWIFSILLGIVVYALFAIGLLSVAF